MISILKPSYSRYRIIKQFADTLDDLDLLKEQDKTSSFYTNLYRWYIGYLIPENG